MNWVFLHNVNDDSTFWAATFSVYPGEWWKCFQQQENEEHGIMDGLNFLTTFDLYQVEQTIFQDKRENILEMVLKCRMQFWVGRCPYVMTAISTNDL